MTEGIIQKTFKKYNVMNEDIVWLLDKIEKELIAEIDKMPVLHYDKRDYIDKKILIGDTK